MRAFKALKDFQTRLNIYFFLLPTKAPFTTRNLIFLDYFRLLTWRLANFQGDRERDWKKKIKREWGRDAKRKKGRASKSGSRKSVSTHAAQCNQTPHIVCVTHTYTHSNVLSGWSETTWIRSWSLEWLMNIHECQQNLQSLLNSVCHCSWNLNSQLRVRVRAR